MNSLNLAPEIIDRILLFSPTFATLKSAILTCKSFHDVFSNHPISIIRATAYNVAGPALPQLIRVIRYEALNEPRSTNVDDIPAESNDISPITSSEVAKIIAYAGVARKLEDVFSMRHKNRSSRSSTLTSLESWRFRRAIYRLMMYSIIFPGNRFTDLDLLPEEFDDEDEEARAKRHQEEKRAWKKFWQEFDTSELYEVWSAAKFLLELGRWTSTCAFMHPGEEASESSLSAGPIRILEGYEARDGELLPEFFNGDTPEEDGEILHAYLSNPMEKIWEERKDKAPDDKSHWGFILDEVIGGDDACAQCQKKEGLNLWGESNYEFMAGISTFSFGRYPRSAGFYRLLKGKLSESFTTTDFLLLQFESLRPEPYSKLMSDLFDLKTSEFDSWKKGDWLCEECLKKFITSHLHLWLLDRRQKAGVTITEDCWYGYNCRTQTHKTLHAQKLNHWCEPTRGD